MTDASLPRRERVKELFVRAQAAEPAERARIFEEAGADPELRREVEQLLNDYASAQKFFAGLPANFAGVLHGPDSQTFSAGELVAERYRIVRLIGEGGMGEVYEAEDVLIRGERIALKTLPPVFATEGRAVERLKSEMATARQITHPNVCRVFDINQHKTASGASIIFFTMELLEGDTLARRLRQHGPMTTSEALPILRQIAAALRAAHAALIVHGDLKPGNVMLVPSGDGTERVVVTDFGLARRAAIASDASSTATSRAGWGTPAYMAPEQFEGRSVTFASDIYAMGAVMREMVLGSSQLDTGQTTVAPRSLDSLQSRWRTAIARCLERDPNARFKTADDVVDALEGATLRRWWLVAAALLVFAGVMSLPPVRAAVVETFLSLSTAVARYTRSERTIALLPFSQQTLTAEDRAFGLGLTAAATERLAALLRDNRAFYVIPAAEVIDTGVDTPVLVQQTLGADLIVSARIVAAADRVRATIELREMSRRGSDGNDPRTADVQADRQRPLGQQVATAIAQLMGISPPAASPRENGEAAHDSTAEDAYLLGLGHFVQGPHSWPAAIAAFERAIQHDGRYAPAYRGLSEVHLESYISTTNPESMNKAVIDIDEALKLDPIDARAHVLRGRIYRLTSQHARAISEFQRALEIDSSDATARTELAKAYAAQGATATAEQTYREAIAVHPRYWSGYEDLGTFLFRQGRYAEAEENYVIGSRYAPANRRTISNLAAVYEIQEKFQAAEIELTKGLKLSPDANLYNNLGWVYILDGKLEEAVGALKEAVKLPLADALVWSSLARACRWSGTHPEEQRAAYTTALEKVEEELHVNPLDAEARANHAYLLAETKRGTEALREIAATLELGNARGNPSVLFRSALTHELVGDRKGALDALESAARRGYPRSRIARDPDLKLLRNDPGYRRILDVAGLDLNQRLNQRRAQ